MSSPAKGIKRERDTDATKADALFDAESSASDSEAPPAKAARAENSSAPNSSAPRLSTKKPIADFFKPIAAKKQSSVAMFLKKPAAGPAGATLAASGPPATTASGPSAKSTPPSPVSPPAPSPEVDATDASSQGSDESPAAAVKSSPPPPKSAAASPVKTAATGASTTAAGNGTSSSSGPVLGPYHPLSAVQGMWGVGEPVPFRALARTLAGVEAITGRHAIQELVCNLFRSIIATSPSDLLPAVYLCCSKLAPEVEGMELGLGEALLTKAICQTTGRQLKDVKVALKEVGDLGLVAEQSRAKQATLGFAAKPKPLLLRDVFSTFKDIAGTSGKASVDAKLRLIKSMLVKASGEEAEPRYIIRGLQGKFRVGLAAKSVLTALAQAVTITPPHVPEGATGPVQGGAGGSFAACMDTRLAAAGKPRSEEKVASELAEADDTLKAVFSELPSFDRIIPALLRGGVAAARQECQLTPGMPVTPMLAKPTKGVGEVLTRLEGIAFTSEWKYDGERAQVHKMPLAAAAGAAAAAPRGHRIFSRNHEETTGKYPDLATILADAEHAGGDNWAPLTPSVKDDPVALEAVMADDVDAAIAASNSAYEESLKLFPAGSIEGELSDFIIDGEVIAYDPETDALLPFQRLSNRARKNVTLENVKVPVVYAAFDLLYLHGQSLLQVPLEVRRTLLKRFFKEVPGKFRFAVGYDTFSGDTDALRAQLDAAVEGHCEGLMVKTLRDNATYEPSRRSLNWLKLKKDYMDGLTDSLDLVVIAGWHGKGKRTGTFGAYLLACYDEDEGEYQAITKVGTGFSDEALAAHTATFSEESNLVRSECPRNVRMSPNFRSAPDAWFEPRVVWEVKAADLSISPVYTAAIGRVDPNKGIALRFPRFLRVRDDKSAEQATNASQVESMYRAQPLAGGSAAAGDDEDGLGQYAME